MIKGIHNQPYIDCSRLVDVGYLNTNFKEICKTIAQSSIGQGIYGPGILDEERYNSYTSCSKNYAEAGQPLTDLTRDQRSLYYKLSEGMYCGYLTSYIRDFKDPNDIKSFLTKSQAAHTEWEHRNKELYKDLINWIYTTLPFEQIGRIFFLISEHRCEIPVHRDGSKYIDNPDEFLWINPGKTKRFYIYDNETDEKVYVDTEVAYFNERDYHGGDAVNTMTWSLRIDGKFTEEFKNKIK